MATLLASATILHGGSKYDVAVPVGTSIGSLMAMLGIDLQGDSLRITHPDGTPIGLGATLGDDVASGAVLALSDADSAEDSSPRRAAARARAAMWLRPALVVSVFLALVTSVELACLVGPALGWWEVAAPVRYAAAALCASALGASLRWRRLRETAAGLLAITGLLGVCGLVLLPIGPTFSPLAPAMAGWTALVATLCVWLLNRAPLAGTAAVVWAMTGLLASFVVASDVPPQVVTTLVLAVSTMAITTIPSFAFRIPESQLLDLPTVTTSAPTVRTPRVPPPSPITAGRVRRSLREADARDRLLLLACCGAAAVTAFPSARLMAFDHWTGRVGIVMMVTAFLVLALGPRARRDPVGRVAPRVSALCVAAAVVVSPQVIEALGAQVASLAVVASGGLLSILTTALVKARPSALIGRAAEITQRLSLFLLLPSAVYAGGLFALVREVAS